MAFIVYAVIFRLAIIAAGLTCIFLGYKLFILGVMPRDGSEVDAKAREIRLTIKNAAPGTIFALFGAFIVALMIMAGIPRLELTGDRQGYSVQFTLRGENSGRSKPVRQNRELNQIDKFDDAIRTYAAALSDSSLRLQDSVEPLLGLASIYYQQNRHDEALAYIRLVLQFQASNSNALDLLSRIEKSRGNLDIVIDAMKEAIKVDPKFKSDLEVLERIQRCIDGP